MAGISRRDSRTSLGPGPAGTQVPGPGPRLVRESRREIPAMKNANYIQSVSESWVCHFAVDAEMVSKNQFYHMERDWFGAKNWPLVAEFLNVATFIEEKLSKKGFGIFSFFSKSLEEKTWNQNSGASFGMTLLFCFQNFVLWSTLKKKNRHQKFKVK